MIKKYKYCDDDDYKDDAYRALLSQFKDRQKFEAFYSSLNNLETKDEFLKVGSTYLSFVKNGNWHVNDPRSNHDVELLCTNSFKLVAIIAIIESLSNKNNVDFFEWLTNKDKSCLFPITDRSQLQKLYNEYKSEYGSIRRCKLFFANLSTPTKDKLRNLITIDGEPVKTIEKVVEMIYKARSDFAHVSNITSEIGDWYHFAKDKNKEILWKRLSMDLLQNCFEEGIVIHFKNITTA